jgi:hypothetical protein
MKPLHMAAAKERFQWTEECQQSVKEMERRMAKMPRAHCDPATLISDESCLIIMSDASDDGIGSGLWRVNKTDAREVTIEDLKNKDVSTLIATDAKVLSESERKWMTFEAEIYGMYRAIKKWGKLLVAATMKYPKTEGCIPKIGIRLDNTTATKTWIGLHEPQLIEHAGAKEMRILGWHERVAFVDRLPIHTAYCPGELNSFSDLVSRIAAKMGEIAAAKKASRQGPAAHHMSAHSFEQEDQRDIPEGFRARHLRLSVDDGEEIHRAMMNDETKVHGEKMSDIYKCVTGCGELTAEKRNKIQPWVGRRYFAVEHPQTKRKMMYTPISHIRIHFEREDATKILVPCIPRGARVKIIEPRPIENAEEAVDGYMKAQLEMRGQIILMCHDMASHPREGPSLKKMRSVSHWEGMAQDMHEHWWTCSNCLPDVRTIKGVGVGIAAMRRFAAIQIDHFVLPKEWADMCGATVILTITDTATRVTSYEVAMNQTAQETARILHDRWFPYYSTPTLLISDPHPGFASEVMEEYRKLFGIKGHDMAAARQKAKTGMVESRHNTLKDVLADGFAKGDIKNARDLQSYCSDAKAKHDFETKGDVTPFECAVGQMPRSPQSLSMVCTERDKLPVEPMINVGKKCLAERKGRTRSCHTAGAEAEEETSKANQERRYNEYNEYQAGSHEETRMKTSARENEDETESEDDIDNEEFDSSDSDEEPAGDTSGEDETHAAHVGHGGACEHTMSDEEFLKWIGRRRTSDETTRKNSEEEHVLKMAKENEADVKLMERINSLSPAGKAQMINTHIEMIMQQEMTRRDQTARDSALSRDRKASRPPYAYDFGLQAGAQVSHADGRLYTIREVSGPQAGQVVSAFIEPARLEEGGKGRWTLACELRPTATPRPSKYLPRERSKVNDFIVWTQDEGEEGEEVKTMRAGRVRQVNERDAIVHVYEGTRLTHKIWLPTWRDHEGNIRRARERPEFCDPHEMIVNDQDVQITGHLTTADRLDRKTRTEMEMRGMI